MNRVGETRYHQGHVLSVDVSTVNSKWVCSGGALGSILLWDMNSPLNPMSPGTPNFNHQIVNVFFVIEYFIYVWKVRVIPKFWLLFSIEIKGTGVLGISPVTYSPFSKKLFLPKCIHYCYEALKNVFVYECLG